MLDSKVVGDLDSWEGGVGAVGVFHLLEVPFAKILE